MGEYRDDYSIKRMCEVLKVSRSGFYAWERREPSLSQRSNEELLRQIQEVHSQSRRLYGSPRVVAELRKQGVRCGKNRVARIMREHSIWGEVKKRRFRRTTDSRHDYALASNLLVGRSQTEGVWASDMMFVPTSEG
jgi:transposase InsO family protein